MQISSEQHISQKSSQKVVDEQLKAQQVNDSEANSQINKDINALSGPQSTKSIMTLSSNYRNALGDIRPDLTEA